jgi:hypothetical protein
MVAITATEFAKNFGRYKEAAQREPIAITSYDRTSGYFVSAQRRQVNRLPKAPRHVVRAFQVIAGGP